MPLQPVAAARFATICEARRPLRCSAVPRSCLWEYPSRVVMKASTKTDTSPANPPGPAVTYKRKLSRAPATAPDVFTARTKRANTANPMVIAAAAQTRLKTTEASPVVEPVAAMSCQFNNMAAPSTLAVALFIGRIPDRGGKRELVRIVSERWVGVKQQ